MGASPFGVNSISSEELFGRGTKCQCCRSKTGTLKCGNCKVTHYCGEECQKRDWAQHKPVCDYYAAQDILDRIDRTFDDRDTANETPSGREWLADALAKLKKAARSGQRDAIYELAFMLKDGHGCAVDLEGYLYNLRRAADAGMYPAEFAYGELLLSGEHGVEKNAREAAGYFERAVTAGHERAALHLYEMHAAGNGVPKDAAEAARWLKRAADLGSREAKAMLARRR